MGAALTPFQIEELTRTLVGLQDDIKMFFSNPEIERAYQEWYLKKYGRSEKEHSNESL